MIKIRLMALLAIPVVGFLLVNTQADNPTKPNVTYNPEVAKASKEGQRAIAGFRVDKSLNVELTAAEPLLANPIAFCIDDKGRFFVAETFRLHKGVTDNRQHPYWLTEDLAARTVEDRLAMYKKHLKKKFADYGKEHDRIRLLEDTNDDGKPDKSTVFADGFNNPEDGLGSGVIARGNKVWYTCIPDVWLLQDADNDGKAEMKKSLSNGYGVHVSFLGHDSHGLKFGPDGKLYFSIGDRGLHVKTKDTTISLPDTGAILRCNPDGSELELVASGMRNPQELAFDKYGNLFTGDNNADSGDKARWVHVVEGGDCGWRIGWQYLKNPPAKLGPWNAEKMWHLRNEEAPAYLLPPVDHIASGPSGLTYNPGVTLLPKKYDDHFFLCDFRGGPGNSGIHTFALKPKGATFELIDRGKIIDNVLVTDAEFGPDGGLYLSDWVDGWRMTGKGRIYKLFDPTKTDNKDVAEVKKLLAKGFILTPNPELRKYLGHADMRVRLNAQFELVRRRRIDMLDAALEQKDNLLARLHGVWGLGQLLALKWSEPNASGLKTLPPIIRGKLKFVLCPYLKDKEAHVRAQVARVLQYADDARVVDLLIPLLKDDNPRVIFETTMSLGKLGDKKAVEPIVEMLRKNADTDTYLRHAGVMALTWIGDKAGLVKHAKDNSPAVRMATLLAMRRLEMPEVAGFLNDVEKRIVAEAAIAIHDKPIPKALPQLAALANRTGLPNKVIYRALNAHFRLGEKANAMALARYATSDSAPANMRLEAIKHLGNWANPPGLDRVVGLWRPLPSRSKEVAADAMRVSLGGIFTGPDQVRSEAAKVAAKLGIKEVGPTLFALVTDKERPATVRVESLKALTALKSDRLEKAMESALSSSQPQLRAEGRSVLAKLHPDRAVTALSEALAKGEIVEKQQALTDLGELKKPAADDLLSGLLKAFNKGTLTPELHLDLIEAAKLRKAKSVAEQLKIYQERINTSGKTDPLAVFHLTLNGGNADAGRRLFFERSELSCVRCHKINGTGGDVGPELTKVAKEKDRKYLLESVVLPSKQIAKGFETVTLLLTNGQVKSGILKSEDKKAIHLMSPEGTLFRVPVMDVDERFAGKSAMPEDLLKHLSKRELRDLVEYLSSLR